MIATNTCPTDDFKNIFLYIWSIQAFHNLGILEYVSKFYYQSYELDSIEFYEMFLDFCEHSETLFNQEYLKVKDYIDTGCSGGGWDHYDEKLSNTFCSIEEASWLRCCLQSTLLASEIRKFVIVLEYNKGFETDYRMIYDLVEFQVFLLMTRDRNKQIKKCSFDYMWKDFFISDKDILKKEFTTYKYQNKTQAIGLNDWCFQSIWTGRAQGNYKFHPDFLDVI